LIDPQLENEIESEPEEDQKTKDKKFAQLFMSGSSKGEARIIERIIDLLEENKLKLAGFGERSECKKKKGEKKNEGKKQTLVVKRK